MNDRFYNPYSIGAQIAKVQARIDPEEFWDKDGYFDEQAYLDALEAAQDYVLDGYINQQGEEYVTRI